MDMPQPVDWKRETPEERVGVGRLADLLEKVVRRHAWIEHCESIGRGFQILDEDGRQYKIEITVLR